MPALKSIAETAKYLGLGRSSIYRMIAKGELKSLKIGRRNLIVMTSIDAFIAANDN